VEAESVLELMFGQWPWIRLIRGVESPVACGADLNDDRECQQRQPVAVDRS
jgi:hypothetical protein